MDGIGVRRLKPKLTQRQALRTAEAAMVDKLLRSQLQPVLAVHTELYDTRVFFAIEQYPSMSHVDEMLYN